MNNTTSTGHYLFDRLYKKMRAENLTPADLLKEARRLKEQEQRAQKERELLAEQNRLIEKEKEEAHIREVTSMDLPLDWENLFDSDPRTSDVHAESIPDGLILSLGNLGRVDIEYISSITGEDLKTVIQTLKGSIYQNPETWGECFYKGWETAEEYLSGNLMRKYRTAQKANITYQGYFSENLRAIKAILPAPVPSQKIYVTLGSPWVPTDIIDDFITHLLRLRKHPYTYTKHDELTGSWELPNKAEYAYTVGSTSTYGTSRLAALHILERTLNMKTVSVTDEVVCLTNKSGKKRVINRPETVLALEKQQKIIDEFRNWVWKDPQRKERLELIFENNFSCVRKRNFNGSFLTFPTMNPEITLYPYQKNAVARILFSPNTLLAHDVGSGKTFIMIAAGMELKRMGLSQKNLYVVPNDLIGQWKSIFYTLYPGANLICVDPKNFTPEKRSAMLRRMRDEQSDGIIIAYSCFEQIPLSREFYLNQLEELNKEISRLKQTQKKNTSNLKKRQEKISRELLKLAAVADHGLICFDELGISRMFVDEAHNFKNVPLDTKVNHVLGIHSGSSKKCREMMDKVRLIQKNNNGGGVVMATGTPITNSITDAFVMQSYLQSGELSMLDLQSFDSWIGMFAERVTEFEIDVDTSGYRLATRFARFHNLPELTSLMASIADFHQIDQSAEIPDFSGYRDAVIPKTPELHAYLQTISARAEEVRAGRINVREDNMLKITTDGRKAALDLRLVAPHADFTYQSKVARCTENLLSIYESTAPQKSTQLVFCDTSTPKQGFNIYDDLREQLIEGGIPPEQIAYIHDATTEKARNQLFARVREGKLRILIGSTFKLGLGVNVQDKLIAVHHLDIPWRPADMTQREGRILRQGNENKQVYIYRYITEGSFDAYSWQLLETKQRFIAALLSGSLTARSGSDIEDTILSYAEVKALAVGNPLIKERVEVANELTRTLTLRKKYLENRLQLQQQLLELPGKLEHQRTIIRNCEQDVTAAQNLPELPPEKRRQIRHRIFSGLLGNALSTRETPLLDYQGFTVLLPTNMNPEKPYIWLQRAGRYYLSMGDTEKGTLIRIDHFLEQLDQHLEKMKKRLDLLLEQENNLRAELAKKENYTPTIEALEERLSAIDRELGVEKK